MDLAARLRAEARRADERRLLVLSGTPAATREAARDALESAAVDPAATRLVGPETMADHLAGQRVAQTQAQSLLGETFDAVVVDCHEACRPNALGSVVGTVDGGGLLCVLAPPLAEWPTHRDDFDASLAVPPFEVDDVTGHVRQRLVTTLRQHAGVAIVNVDGEPTVERDGLTDPDPRSETPAPTVPSDTAFPTTAYEAALTHDQTRALRALEALREGEAVVVEADRGRGKSSAAGLAAASLAFEGNDVLVTAPRFANAAEGFARAQELLEECGTLTDHGDGAPPRRLETATGRVRYSAPAEATALPGDPDVVIVDEAAAVPVRVLESFLAADAVAFVTTVHGYEGAGRGFSVRFQDRLAEAKRSVTDCEMREPIRYAPGDPVERWAVRALALDARPPVTEAVSEASPATVSYERIDPATLATDEARLKALFGLLVLAHYRTEPDDLARLLDAPNVSIRALVHDGHVVSVALLAREGALSPDLRASMYEGARVRGNMIPDVLTSQLRDEAAGEAVGQRVLRIATHHAVRSEGLGSLLLERVRNEFADQMDWLGVGYGATPELIRFWRANGYHAVHCSTTRNDRSGEHSLVMLDPTSPAGEALCERHTAWFAGRVASMCTDPLASLDADVVRETLSGIATAPSLDLSAWEWRVVAGAAGGQAIFDTAPGPFRRLAVRYLVDHGGDVAGEGESAPALSARAERLLVRKALQAEDWAAVAVDLDYPSRAECMRALGRVTGHLVERYGPDAAREELARHD
jgi:tRNA(Met) cytidine acetyltransferase